MIVWFNLYCINKKYYNNKITKYRQFNKKSSKAKFFCLTISCNRFLFVKSEEYKFFSTTFLQESFLVTSKRLAQHLIQNPILYFSHLIYTSHQQPPTPLITSLYVLTSGNYYNISIITITVPHEGPPYQKKRPLQKI